MKHFLPFLLLLLGFGCDVSAATYNLTPTANLQKLSREATTTSEDTYIFTPGVSGITTYVQIVATTVGVLIHSTSGMSQSDGFPIPTGVGFTFKVEGVTTIYLSGNGGTGSVDMIVLHQ